ncbi:MAG: glucosaminidase domain-containing protein [Bacteroidales bacterium]|nr:glucosaminidase domain-containing protein [Bacteroidales bacterium]
MRKRMLFLLAFVFALLSGTTPQDAYIRQYASVAVSEMYRSGIPASITLAQGLLESNAGQSELATKGNNHFGIKCHRDWKGPSMRYDDDRKKECFRKYAHAEESYRDHSDFLRYRDRYKYLFDYPLTDYKSWAYGLKKAGYATDPAYPTKLIELIERYNLQRFDTMQPGDAGLESTPPSEEKKKADKEAVAQGVPWPPLKLEEATRVENPGEITFSLSRSIYAKNGVPFVYAMEGETYEDIAESFNLFVREIYRFNDLKKGSRQPVPGEVVYIHAKKRKTARGLDKHVVESADETLWEIAQRYGVTLDSIRKRNSFGENYFLAEGDVIKLR